MAHPQRPGTQIAIRRPLSPTDNFILWGGGEDADWEPATFFALCARTIASAKLRESCARLLLNRDGHTPEERDRLRRRRRLISFKENTSALNRSPAHDDLERLWDHPNSPPTLKKRILRTVLEEVVADTTDDPPTVHLKLHWAGGVHTELTVRKNRTGHHDHVNSQLKIRCARGLLRFFPVVFGIGVMEAIPA